MNENTFQSQRSHTRLKFEPLRTSCILRCITPQSPMAQSVNTLVNPVEYEPDRTVSPTVILPEVRAVDPDNVFTHGACNEYLSIASSDLKWYIDGEPISDVWTAGVDYDIVTEASDARGALRVYKNLTAGERKVLHFSGVFLDWRTGIAYEVNSDDKALTATDKGEDTFSCNVDKPLIEYDPLYDDLLLYDYKVARGITVQGTRASHIDGKCFEQAVTVVLTKGENVLTSLPSGVTMRLVYLGQSTAITPNSTTSPEVLLATFPTVKFDMRMIAKGEYEVQFLKNSQIITRCTIGLNTVTSMPSDGKPLFGSDIVPSQSWYENKCLLNLPDRFIEYPELYYFIKWYTQAKYNDNDVWRYATAKQWQFGERLGVDVADLGIGVTYNDSFFDLWFDVDPHAKRELLLDETNDVLLDENNEYLID